MANARNRGRRHLLLLPLAALAVGAALLVPRVAAAQDVAAAEALFREGRALLEQGDYANACPKLAESNRLDPSSGTALNLALCHQKQGKTATAWAEYLVAARLARQQQKQDRADEATAKAADLEKQLSHLTIVVTSPVPNLEVKRDDVKIEASALGTSLPTDPGKHVITASAPGYKTATLEVTVGAAHDAQTATVPPLEAGANAASGGPTRASGASPLPWIVGGAGVAALAVGGVFGGLALKTYGDAKDACPSRTACSSDALSTRSRADTFANVANVSIGVGVVGVGVAAALFLFRKKPAADTASASHAGPALSFAPFAGSTDAGLRVTGSF
jgi:hypothetical protein